MAAAKKNPIKAIEKAAKKVKGTGVLMSKKEMDELLKSPPTKKAAPKKKAATKKPVKKK